MPLLELPSSGISLEGGDGDDMPQMLGLTLNEAAIEQMLQSVMTGGKMELTLGKDPKITFGDMTQHLTSSSDPFLHEIYTTPYIKPKPKHLEDEDDDDMSGNSSSGRPKAAPATKVGFTGMFLKGKKGVVRTVKVDKKGKEIVSDPAATAAATKDPVTAGSDSALAALQKSLASEGARKAANTTKVVKGLDMNNKKGGSKNRFLTSHNSFAGGTPRSMPSSPSLTGVGSPRHAPTSVPLSASEQQAEKVKAIRSPIIHILAAEPSTKTRLHRLKKDAWTEEEFQAAIDKVADDDGSVYVLRQKMYKELDVFNYRYMDEEDRQKAINNAVKAYDKMRLESSAPEWERLLPKEERGTGKCLSKLQAKIATGTAKPPKINVSRPADSGAESGADDLFGDVNGENTARSNSQPPSTAKPKRPSEKEAQAKRLMGKGGVVKSTAKSGTTKKAGSKNEDKFLSSQYIEDSDEDLADDHAVTPESTITVKQPKVTAKPAAPVKKPVSPAPKSTHKRNVSSTTSSSGGSDTPIAKKWMSERKAKQEKAAASTGTNGHLTKDKEHVKGKSPVPKNPVLHHAPKRPLTDHDNDAEKSPVPAKKPRVEALPTPAPNAAGKKVPSPNAAARPSPHRASDASSRSSSSGNSNVNGVSNGTVSTNTTRPRSGTQKSSPLALSPPTNASDLSDRDHSYSNSHSDADAPYQSSSSTDKSAASHLAARNSKINGASTKIKEQPTSVMDTARRFKTYYKKYLDDYRALERLGPRARVERREEWDRLLEMHERLRRMKDEVCRGYVR